MQNLHENENDSVWLDKAVKIIFFYWKRIKLVRMDQPFASKNTLLFQLCSKCLYFRPTRYGFHSKLLLKWRSKCCKILVFKTTFWTLICTWLQNFIRYMSNLGNGRGSKYTAQIEVSLHATQISEHKAYRSKLWKNYIRDILVALVYWLYKYKKLDSEPLSICKTFLISTFRSGFAATVQ